MCNSRRDFLRNLGYGLGATSISGVIPGMGYFSAASAAELVDPLAAKKPHYPGKIKSVIWLFQNGGPSTIDLFDYKPQLIKMAGQEVPASFLQGIRTSVRGGSGAKLFVANGRTWKQYGESGAWFSNLMPNLAQRADDLTFIKSSVTVGATHEISTLKLHTGDLNPGRPSLGAWISYALGSANPDLPPYVVLYNGDSEPRGGATNWGSGFLPAVYQATAFRPGASPIFYLEKPDLMSVDQQRASLDLLRQLNQFGVEKRPADTELQARLRSYELADRMQVAAPEAVDISKETDATKAMYGLDDPISATYGNTLLRARRLVERGVRFVQVVSGAPEGEAEIMNWDAHGDLPKNHNLMARMVDKPVAGLLADLKSRGLLDSTLVVWTSEFSRTPWGESGTGRDHNPWGYTQWMAGGGLKPGISYGETDELGVQVADKEKAVDTYDLHATILHLMGLNHLKTTFQNNGRSERPTVVYGKVIKDILA